MSVPLNERSEGKLEVIVKARELAVCTIQITNNPKNFNPTIDMTMIAMLKQSAIRIYQLCRQANKMPLDPFLRREAEERRKMQNLAMAQCEDLSGLIEISKSLYHLSSKRVRYWTDLTYKLQAKIKAWRDSDLRRYRSV